MTAVAATPDEPRPGPARAAAYYLIDRPLIMLSVILVLLLIACEIVSPGYMSAGRIGSILQFSAGQRLAHSSASSFERAWISQ